MSINVTLFVQMLVFGLLVWFTMTFVWPLMRQAMEEREQKIADGLAAAEKGQSDLEQAEVCLLYTSPSPRDGLLSRMPSSA